MTQFPNGWRLLTVDQVGRVGLGRQRHPDWHNGPEMRPYLRVANVFEDRIDARDIKEMDFSGCFERFRLEPGDVLLNEGQTPELLGRPAIYRGNPPDVAFTNTLIRFQAGAEVSPEWALIVFRRHMHFGRFTRESRITTNIAHLSAARFKTVEFPVPPLDEQRRIVDILEDHLSRLDAAASSVEAAERRLIALRRSTLNALFSGSDYPRVPLRELVVGIEAGRSFGGSFHPASDDEWGIIKVSARTWGTFRANENKAIASDRADARYEINKGDLLISRANTTAYVGASVLVGEVRPRLLLSDKSLRILAAPGVEREWLWRALSAPDARSQMAAAATGTKDSMRNISQSALLNIELSAVPVADQKAAVAISLEVDTGIQRLTVDLEAAAVRGMRLRHALLGAAFSGRLTGRATDMEMVEEMASV